MGTGLSGGANAVEGCVVLCLEAIAVLEIDPRERIAVVQPGVVGDHLRTAVAEHGHWYPPDPASLPWSTIGGNVATNARGCAAFCRASPVTTSSVSRSSPAPARWSGSAA
ncbi:FAD-binding protein [Janibacter sp. Y6]|uniref:FAD-binding oxidoreductase n=1 Tax=Janibacter sp. Y6 TaxID=2913552 RepID=UPI0034A4C4D6